MVLGGFVFKIVASLITTYTKSSPSSQNRIWENLNSIDDSRQNKFKTKYIHIWMYALVYAFCWLHSYQNVLRFLMISLLLLLSLFFSFRLWIFLVKIYFSVYFMLYHRNMGLLNKLNLWEWNCVAEGLKINKLSINYILMLLIYVCVSLSLSW